MVCLAVLRRGGSDRADGGTSDAAVDELRRLMLCDAWDAGLAARVVASFARAGWPGAVPVERHRIHDRGQAFDDRTITRLGLVHRKIIGNSGGTTPTDEREAAVTRALQAVLDGTVRVEVEAVELDAGPAVLERLAERSVHGKLVFEVARRGMPRLTVILVQVYLNCEHINAGASGP